MQAAQWRDKEQQGLTTQAQAGKNFVYLRGPRSRLYFGGYMALFTVAFVGSTFQLVQYARVSPCAVRSKDEANKTGQSQEGWRVGVSSVACKHIRYRIAVHLGRSTDRLSRMS